ncbi:ParB/RepB/Spo0J family partition protein [Pseudomonadota bacterium]|nr:ParB/RepB/Spo0J family partition protein [Pseudomonadota bacterium]
MKKIINSKKKGLGRGLSSLLGQENPIKTTEPEKNINNSNYKLVPIELIEPGPWQPRKMFDKNNMHTLAESIKKQGIIQPVVLKTKKNNPNKYFLIAGERRWRAAQLAKVHRIPAIIRDDVEENKIPELALVENIQRSELNAIEEAEGYLSLINKYKYTQEEVSKAVSKSRSHIANMIRILTLTDLAKNLLEENKLSIGQLRPLIGNEDCDEIIKIILKNKLSAREVENLVKKGIKSKVSKQLKKSIDIVNLQKNLSEICGINITIDFDYKKEKGSIYLKCENLLEFDYIIKKIKA